MARPHRCDVPGCRLHRPTAETMRACRLDGCEIHPGVPRPRTLSTAAYAQMREDAADGVSVTDIARLFDTSRSTVYAALRGARH